MYIPEEIILAVLLAIAIFTCCVSYMKNGWHWWFLGFFEAALMAAYAMTTK